MWYITPCGYFYVNTIVKDIVFNIITVTVTINAVCNYLSIPTENVSAEYVKRQV